MKNDNYPDGFSYAEYEKYHGLDREAERLSQDEIDDMIYDAEMDAGAIDAERERMEEARREKGRT